MRMRWQGLELPSRVIRDDAVSTDSYGRFTVEPFEQGYGATLGNSMRRVLLSSLEGSAVTSVKITGVTHEFCSMDGVLEDVTDILLNIKGIVVGMTGADHKTMTLKRNTAGEIRAGDIVTDPAVTIANPDHLIATLTADVEFECEMTVETSRGYATVADNRQPEQDLGVIPIDSIFSPILRVRYRTESMRVGQHTNYDRLILEIWTKGTVSPEDALVEAGMILRKHINPFVMYYEMGSDRVESRCEMPSAASPEDSAMDEILDSPVSSLNLSARASNCLDAARVTTIRDLVTRSEGDLLRFRSFGKTSLHEVQRKLTEMGLSLGSAAVNELAALDAEAAAGGATTEGAAPADGGTIGGTIGGPPDDPSNGPMEVYTMGD
jgi:DNA-directed RNA polymerase subunit alpha